MNKILCVCFLLTTMACTDKQFMPESGILGKWKLVSYTKKNTKSEFETIAVPSDKQVYVSFSKSKKYEETYKNTKPVEYGFLSGQGNYKIEDNKVRIVTFLMSSVDGVLFDIASLDSKKMILKREHFGEYLFEK